jgi:RimJ/RimL family protein N-acetyltransferase
MILARDVGYNSFSRPGQFFVDSPDDAQAWIQKRMNLFVERKLGKFPISLKGTREFIDTCGLSFARIHKAGTHDKMGARRKKNLTSA